MSSKYEWLYCNYDWMDLINIIKLEKNPSKRLEQFKFFLNADGLTMKDVVNTWTVLVEGDLENAASEWFHEDVFFNYHETNDVIYWFFNIHTGEARHIKYTVKIDCSGIIVD